MKRPVRKPPSRKRGLKILVFVVLALPIAALVALWMCFDDEPHVMYQGDLSQQSYEKAQEFIESHDPRNVGEGGVQTLVASEDEVNLVVNYAARRLRQAAARVTLHPGAATVQASVPVPSSPFGPWLNVEAVVRESQGLPVVQRLKLGSVRVPSFLAEYALERALERYGAVEQGRVAKDMVKHVAFTDTQVKVVYEWRQDLVKRALSTLTSADDQERFRAYSARLFQTVEGSGRRTSMSLAQLMTPLFKLAEQRSAEGNAARENRAAIITLAFFANDRSLSTLIPAAASWPAPVPIQVTLGGRDDLAKHFLVSAALAMEGGSALSNAIGVHKEVDDAKRFDRDREGFSFHDLVADKAGARFGSLSIRSPQKIQRAVAAGVKEADFMPPFRDLAENIPEPEFKRRYGGVGAPAYNNVVEDIETRVARTPLLR